MNCARACSAASPSWDSRVGAGDGVSGLAVAVRRSGALSALLAARRPVSDDPRGQLGSRRAGLYVDVKPDLPLIGPHPQPLSFVRRGERPPPNPSFVRRGGTEMLPPLRKGRGGVSLRVSP